MGQRKGRGLEGLCVDWSREGRGARIWHVDWILIPISSSPTPIRAAQIYIAGFSSAALRERGEREKIPLALACAAASPSSVMDMGQARSTRELGLRSRKPQVFFSCGC